MGQWRSRHLQKCHGTSGGALHVVTYDRRGFSRSQLDGPRDYDHRLEIDADDIRRLIEHLSDEPATIFGSSSGGVVVLEVLTPPLRGSHAR
ncbi:MAG: alpha/beta fold hydrolase [Pseudonocardiaceae bacterium]